VGLQSFAAWRKSAHSGGNGAQCVEVAANLPNVIAIRDSAGPWVQCST